MKLPIWQPRDRQMFERRHYDPPALWYAVILGSVFIHLSAFGILRLLVMVGLVGTPSVTKLIPINVIAIASSKPNAISTTKLPSQTTAKPTTSTSSPTRTKTPTGATKQPAANTRKSPASNSSKPSERLQPKTKPSAPTGKNNQPSTGQNNQPGTATTTPNSPSPIGTPTNKPTPNSQSGGGFIALPGKLALIPSKTDILHPGNPNYNDELAELLNGSNQQLSAADLKQLGISLNRDLELKVELVVKTDGTAEVLAVSLVTGSLSQDNALVIANKIVPQLRFKPTKMAGSFVYGNYSLPLIIRPAPQ